MSGPIVGLRSPSDLVGGIVYFGRMIDKIRLHQTGKLPAEYVKNLGKRHDAWCVHFLRISYPALVDRVAEVFATDDELLEWAYKSGQRPDDEDINVWNAFMTKRGWNDDESQTLVMRKAEANLSDRDDIETLFRFIDADEGRL